MAMLTESLNFGHLFSLKEFLHTVTNKYLCYMPKNNYLNKTLQHAEAFAKSPYNAYAFRAVANSTIGDFSDDELLRNMPFPSVRGISVWFSSLVKSMHRILESDKLNIGATRPQLFFPIFRLE
jgi:hypothetical protein